MIQKNDGQNVHLENASDADLKITLFPNVKKHLNITRNDKN